MNLSKKGLPYQNDSNISFWYDVIKVWKLKKLYSLLPLMEMEPNETAEELLEKVKKLS